MTGDSNWTWIDPPVSSTPPEARRRALRSFGTVMAVVFCLLGGFAAWQNQPFAPYLLALGAGFLSMGLLAPRWLDPIERLWMRLAGVLSAIMTRVILVLAFVVVITPVGLLRRLFVGDWLGLRPDSKIKSYWVPVDKKGPQSRLDKPY